MSLFHHKHAAILGQSEYTVVLAAELDSASKPGRLTRLLFTGHDGDRGVLRAIVPGGDTLWDARFSSDHDIREGLIALAADVVVTHDRAGNALVGHELWTGKEKWRTAIGQLVDRLGIDGSNHEIVAVTLDHVVHGINISTGSDHPRGSVMTDEARQTLMQATVSPCSASWNQGSSHASNRPNWSRTFAVSRELEVLRRDWAGSEVWALARVGAAPTEPFRELGQGRFEGAQQVGALSVLRFDLQPAADDRESRKGPHFFLIGPGAVVLGILREDGHSEFFEHDRAFWTGAL